MVDRYPVVIAPANVHDTKLLEATLEAIVVQRPRPTAEQPQHWCLDKAYDNPPGHATVAKFHYTPHICAIGETPPKRRQRNILRDVGWWNERRRGSPSIARFWFAMTRILRTTADCFNSLVR